MELRAVIKALEWIDANKKRLRFPQFVIYSDSQYVVDNQHRAAGWRKNKWVNHHGKPVYNQKLWREFLNTRDKVSVQIQKVKGKSSEATLMVDKIVKAFGKKPTLKDLGYVSGNFSRSKTGKGLTQLFPADNKTYTINHFADKRIGGGEYEVKFDLFSVEDETYVGKYKAYVSEKIVNQLHRGNHFDVMFNNDRKHPMILDIAENIDL
jgi:hypothetical protein